MPDANFYLERGKARMNEKITEDPDASIDSWVIMQRQGQDVLMLFGGSPRFLARICAPAAVGFEADEIAFIADAFGANSPTNPEGKKWEPGEMQGRKHEPAVRALLYESLWATVVKKGDTVALYHGAPYERIGTMIEWKEFPEPIPMHGFIPRNLLRAVNEPSLAELAEKSGDLGKMLLDVRADLSDEDRWFHQRIGTVKSLIRLAEEANEKLGFAIVSEDPGEEGRLKEALAREGADVWSTHG
jgi:hypothetical protein